MNSWIRFTLAALCLSVMSTSASLVAGNNSGKPKSAGNRATANTSCRWESEVSNAVQKLSAAGNNKEMAVAQQSLLDYAKRSSKCRRQVIDVLMSAMDKPDLDSSRDFFLWHYGSSLLVDLRATEAIDLLVKHLDFTDDTSINVSHYPAMGALIGMGPLAIPTLGADLSRTSNPGRQLRAVFCISQIGGVRAIATLKQALSLHHDPCVNKFITISIDTLENKQTPGRIRSQDWARWQAAFSCKELISRSSTIR